MFSDSIWKKQKSYLEQQASNISILKKEITKQTEIDANVQQSITDKIDNLKLNATHLAKKLQQEKHKNGQLDTIIKHMKGQMEQQKLSQASFRNNINSQNLDSLENKFKKLEYDLGQVNGKVNRMSQNLEQKKNKISQNRTQRVIDSGIFRNIEKQLIDSELTFKKLLIQKIKYQKEYEKIYQEYNSLKEKASNYYVRNDSTRTKTSKEITHSKDNLPLDTCQKKFLQVEMNRPNNSRYTAQIKMNEQIDQEQEKQIIRVKKMLIETNLQNCLDLVYFYSNIDQINDKYFNQINIYTDQSNQIEKYMAQMNSQKNMNKIRLVQEKQYLTKQQLNTLQFRDKKQKNKELKIEVNSQLQELTSLWESDQFKLLLQNLNIQHSSLAEQGYLNFDLLKQTLQLVDLSISPLLHDPVKFEEEKNITVRQGGSEKLQEMISKVRKNDEHYKVMKKQEFKEQYQKLVKNVSQKTVGNRNMNKKKSFPSIKK